MADERILGSGVAGIDHIAVFDEIWRDRLAAIDTNVLLIYLVDIVPEDALVWLARQFGVMGNEGWAFADTVAKRRDLIKAAVDLHRRKGTPYAVKSSVERATDISYADITIIEGEDIPPGPIYYDGTYNHSGAVTHGSAWHWSFFRVVVDTSGTGTVWDADLYALLFALIREYKPARSTMSELGLLVPLEDETTPEDELAIVGGLGFEDTANVSLYYNGAATHDGTYQHDSDFLILTVI